MNMALSEWSAANSYAKPKDIESVMHILASAGFNAETWRPLTSGYEIYWDKQENKMVLYNASSAQLEYPDEYEGNEFTAQNLTDRRFEPYDGNVELALSYNYSFSSSTVSQEADKSLSSATSTNDAAATFNSAIAGESGSQIKSAIGLSESDSVYVNASATNYSSTYNSSNPSASTYAAITAMHLSNQADIQLDNNGELKANTFVITVKKAENATPAQIAQAEKDAGSMLYSVMVQSNAGLLESEVSVVIPGDTVIDVSNNEWKAAKSWQGYIGSSDPKHPCVIKGLKLTEATSYALTYQMNGSSSRYNITGFIGALYGNSTLENVIFDDVEIDSPGKDYVIAEGQKNRNTVAVVGGIIPDLGNRQEPVNVTIRNVVVNDNCKIKGIASVGGIVGYIGAEQVQKNNAPFDLKGNVLIENCKFAGTIISTDETYASKAGYSPAGGILGFTCRCSNDANITIKDCAFTGSVTGQGSVGGIVGGIITGNVKIENCSVAGATVTANGTEGNTAKLVGYTQKNITIDSATLGTVATGDVYAMLYSSKEGKITVNETEYSFTKKTFKDLVKE